MVAFDPVVFPLAVNMQNTFAREFKAVHFADHMGIAVGLVGGDRPRLLEPGFLAGLPEESPCCLDVPTCR